MPTIRVTVERETIDRLAEMAASLSRLKQVVPSAVDLRQTVRGLSQCPAALNLSFAVTGGAFDQRVSLEPSDFERKLMATVRALDREGDRLG